MRSITGRTSAIACLLAAAILAISALAEAQGTPTRILVRAIARDAKAIGTGVGGALITFKDAKTGEVLAQGEQQGATGETPRIMIEPRPRDETIFGTPDAAHFTATLDLKRPTIVEITAEGPLDTPDYMYKASKTMLLLPGQDVLGEGVIIVVHGFRVTLADSPASPVSSGDDIPLTANVVLL